MKPLIILRKIITLMAVVFALTASVNRSAQAWGERYSEEGHILSAAIRENLVKEGFCSSISACLKRIDAYGGHGNKVNLTYYGAKERELIGSIISYVVLHGLEKTKGVAIHLSFHEETRESQGNSVFAKKPIIDLEINK